MKRWVAVAMTLAMWAMPACARDTIPPEWTQVQQPFRVIGDIYYAGSAELAAYLIVTPKGDILLDGGLAENAGMVEKNIAALGFNIRNVKILLNSHAHYDHAGALAQLKRDSGATFYASAGDKPILQAGRIGWGPSASDPYPPVMVDRVIGDGETVSLGGVTLTAHLTPGHTPGCTTWAMPVREDGMEYHVVFYCSLTVAGNPLVNNAGYPQIAQDYKSSFAKLKAMRADVFLGPHASFFDMQDKLARRAPGKPNPFVDAGEFQAAVADSEKQFEKDLRRQQQAAASGSQQ